MTLAPPTIGAIRVSTDQQADRYGPDRQRDDVLREAERQGLTITQWVEEAISGTDHDRAAENTYYQLARQHQGLNVIFSHPNRVGRHVEVTVGIARTIHTLGGTVWIAGVGSLREARAWKSFLRDAAEAESDHAEIVERLQRGKYDKAVRNRWPHGQPPYGYRIVRDDRGKSLTLERQPETAPIVDRIFREALAGTSATQIALGLVRAEVPVARPHTSTTQRWTVRQVLYVLKNEAYTGRREFTGPHGETAVVTFPGLVTAAEFQQVQRLTHGRISHRSGRTTRPALFAGHLRCGLCGGSLTVLVSRDRNGEARYMYYRCAHTYQGATAALVGTGRTCTNRTGHKVEALDVEGWNLFCAAMTDPEFLARAAQPATPTGPDHSARMAELRAQMAETVRRAVTHHLPDDVLDGALTPLRDELARLERDSLPQPVAPTPDMTDLAAHLGALLPSLTTLEQRREALDTWGVRLILAPERTPVVKITFSA